MVNSQANLVLHHVRQILAAQDADHFSDQQLLQRFIQEQDESAFAALVRRHGSMVLNVCQRILHNCHDAEDAFQATFLILARQAAARSWQESIGNWLYLVAYRLALKLKAETERRSLHEGRAEVHTPSDPLAAVSGREFCAALDEELGRLSERCRAPLVLCCLEGLTRDEAARQLGWSLGTLKRRLEQGRALLRQRLVRRGFTLSATLGAGLWTEKATQAALPFALVQSAVRPAVQIALGRVAPAALVSARVAALSDGVLRSMGVAKLKIALAVVLTVGLIGAGVGLAFQKAPPSKSAEEQPDLPRLPAREAGPKKAEPPALDQFGDPLPPGAIARMGTVRFRHGGAINTVAYSPDGKVVLAGSSTELCVWDAATGKALRWLSGFSQLGHPLVLSPDLKTVVAATQEGNIELWDVATAKKLRSWQVPGHKELPRWERLFWAIACSPDAGIVATCGHDGVLRLWDSTEGKEVRQLTGPGGCRKPVVFSPDSRRVAYGKDDLTIHVSDVVTGNEVAQLGKKWEMPAGVITTWSTTVASLGFSPDGRVLASVTIASVNNGPMDSTAVLWDVSTGKELLRPTASGQQLRWFTFSPDGKTLAARAADDSIRLLEPATGKERDRLPGNAGGSSLAFSADGTKLVAGGWDCQVHQWDLATRQELHTTGGHQNKVDAVAFAPDGRTLATVSADRTLRLWDVPSGRELRRLDIAEVIGELYEWSGLGSVLIFSPDGRELLTNCTDLTIRFLDPATGRELRRIRLGDKRFAVALSLSLDGKTLAASEMVRSELYGLTDCKVTLWDVATGKQLRTLQGPHGLILHFAFQPDGQTLFGESVDRLTNQVGLHWWDVATGKEWRRLDTFPEDKKGRIALAFSPDGSRVAFFDNEVKEKQVEYYIRLHDLGAGREVRRWQVPEAQAYALAFAPDGRTLAGKSDYDGTIRLWEVATGKERRVLTGHRGLGRALAFSTDGTMLASGAYDTTALVWDLAGRLNRKGNPLTTKDLDLHWAELAGDDAVRADEAIRMLSGSPQQALPLLRERLPPAAPTDAKRLARLLGELDSATFATREQATADLEKLGDLAAPALRKALEGSPPAEVRRRIEQLLDKVAQEAVAPSPERLRKERALEVLERTGDAEARKVLEALSRGMPEAWLTQQAKASLERLMRQTGGSH